MSRNGLQEDLFSQITDEVKELIKSRIPEDRIPVENWEWNVLYKIFEKPSIDTSLLLRISSILNYDFFKYYTDSLKDRE